MPQCSGIRETNLERIWGKSNLYMDKNIGFYFKLDLKILESFKPKRQNNLHPLYQYNSATEDSSLEG